MKERFKRLFAGKVPQSLWADINRKVGQGLHRHNMLEDGDRIVVGVSGGKDSLVLLWVLAERLTRAPVNYSLFAVHVNPGFSFGHEKAISDFCADLEIPFFAEQTDFGLVAHSDENRENPCFLCSRLRRQRLFEAARRLNCNKIALGHHKDDLIETFFLNICYAGEAAGMAPAQVFFKGAITVIRPLAYADEAKIARFASLMQMPVAKLGCPSEQSSKRRLVKGYLEQLYQENKKIRGNIFRALSRGF
jgi:tRNA 2-thiocytidine biosynthesis protein TtcA